MHSLNPNKGGGTLHFSILRTCLDYHATALIQHRCGNPDGEHINSVNRFLSYCLCCPSIYEGAIMSSFLGGFPLNASSCH